MGAGKYSVDSYHSRVAAKAAAGIPTFDHTAAILAGDRDVGVHELLDPKWVNKQGPHTGKNIREAMIGDDHPNPTAIAVVLDVTGSNFAAATVAHSKLPQLHGLLQRKGYVEDPQILFGATGDANFDAVPLQMGQFESDNRMDEQLEAMYLEGGGGGQVHETYELAAYFLARHTYLETFEKLGKKGYAFFIGDEMPYETVLRSYGFSGHTLESLIGDSLEADIPTEQIFAELQEKFHVFFLFQKQGSYHEDEILPTWRKLLGERALVLDDPAAVCEFIAGVLGMMEGGIDYQETLDDLLAIGADPDAVKAAGKALATVASSSSGAVATVTADGDDLPASDDETGAERL
jgi:hypothetical protein